MKALCYPSESLSKEENRAITEGLMKLTEEALASFLENEEDIYTIDDLKIRFR